MPLLGAVAVGRIGASALGRAGVDDGAGVLAAKLFGLGWFAERSVSLDAGGALCGVGVAVATAASASTGFFSGFGWAVGWTFGWTLG